MNNNMLDQGNNILTTEEDLQELFRDEINCPARSIFQTCTWMKTWWDVYGKDKKICSGEISSNGIKYANFPLYIRMRRYFGTFPYREMAIIGTGEKVSTDFHDFLVRPEYDDSTLSDKFKTFLLNTSPQWDVVKLAEFDSDSKIYSAILSNGKNLPFRWVLEDGEECPYQDLPDKPEDYFKKVLSTSMKKSMNNKINKINKSYSVTFEINCEKEYLKDRMHNFRIYHQARWSRKGEEGIFHDPLKARFINSITEKLFENGSLFLSTLLFDSEPAASMLCFLNNNKLYYFQSALNEKYSSSNAGWICLLRTIQAAIERGATRIEMLRGDEDYKHHFAKSSRSTYRMIIFNNNVRGRFQYICRTTGVENIFRGGRSILDDVSRKYKTIRGNQNGEKGIQS